MRDHLKFAMAYWHTIGAEGVDMFGSGTLDKSFGKEDPMDIYRAKADCIFHMMDVLNIDYYCFHDADIAPEGATVKESIENFKVMVDYPTPAEELKILQQHATTRKPQPVAPIIAPEDVERIRDLADEIFMDAKIEEYIVNLVDCTRHPDKYGLAQLKPLIQYGGSPRATIFLAQAAKAQALLDGRGYTTPQDVKTVAPDVLRHRVTLTYEADAEEITSAQVIKQVLDTVPVP